MQLAMIDGQMMHYEQLDRHWLNFGTFFGDGIYETVRSYNSKIFALDDHMQRLHNSLQAIEINVDIEKIKADIIKAFNEANIADAKIYIQITRGCGDRSHTDIGLEAQILITISELPSSCDQKTYGIKAIICPDLRWKRCDIKSLNLLPNVMASREAAKKGAQEAILVNDKGYITEGASSGLYFVFKNKVYTSPLRANILPSVTRKYIVKACNELGLCVIERQLKVKKALKADEIFMGVTTRDVVAIVEVDQKPISDGKKGVVASKIEAEFVKYTK